jgi:hypothetical protein
VNKPAGLQTARILRLPSQPKARGHVSETLLALLAVLYANTHVGVLANRAVDRYSNYQRVTNGSNPAHGEAQPKGGPTKSAEVFALPNYVPFLAGLASPLLKLTRMGGCRTATEDNRGERPTES